MTILIGAARAVLTALLLCAASSAFAQDPLGSTETEEPIATDRPGNGNAATTVPQWRLQIEGSVGYAFDTQPGSDAHLVSFPTALRFGLLPFLELRLGTGLLGIDANPVDEAKVANATDTSVGTKLQAFENDGWTPSLGFMVDVFLPSGRGPFTADVVVPDTRVAASWALPKGFGLLLNTGADVPEDDAGRFARFIYVANLSYALPRLEALSVFVESFGQIPTAAGRDPVVQIDVGAAFLLGPDWQLDVFTQHGLTAESPDFQVALGLSARI